jgi:hypothetical protein
MVDLNVSWNLFNSLGENLIVFQNARASPPPTFTPAVPNTATPAHLLLFYTSTTESQILLRSSAIATTTPTTTTTTK